MRFFARVLQTGEFGKVSLMRKKEKYIHFSAVYVCLEWGIK